MTATASLREGARSVAAWFLLLALSIDALALVLEPAFVVLRGGPIRAGVATGVAAVGLSVLVAAAGAVPVAAVHGLVRWIGRARVGRYLWPAPVVLAAGVVVLALVPHKVIHALSVEEGQLAVAAGLVATVVVARGVTKIQSAGGRIGVALALTCGTLVANAELPYTITNESRDVLWICTVLLFAAGLYPLRTWAEARSHERASRWAVLVFVASLPLVPAASFVARDWRSHAQNGGRFALRLARFCRAMVDFDDDGFSPVMWGTDCNDLEPGIHPTVRERVDGVDRNCNGKTRPAVPSLAERGLSPTVGSPDALPGEIDRVVLVTIDCLRADAVTPAVMPRMVELASRGIRFARLYSQGARTTMSLPFLLRGGMEAPGIAETLGREGISSTAAFGYRHGSLEGNVFDGFQLVLRPEETDRRIRAPELTDLAIADLRDPAHAQRHFLWVHYFDAHGPRSRRVLPASVPTLSPMPGEPDKDSALYLSELAMVDESVGRLVASIAHPERALVIVTNDHGEGFGRHGVYAHGVSAFEAIVHAPGFALMPGAAPGTYAHVLAQRDIAATVLGAFGLVSKHPEVETFGRSWLRLRGPVDAAGVYTIADWPLHEYVVSYETTLPFEHWADAPMASIEDDHGKLSVSYVDGIVRLFDLEADPGENHDVAVERPADVARYRGELETFRDIDAPPP